MLFTETATTFLTSKEKIALSSTRSRTLKPVLGIQLLEKPTVRFGLKQYLFSKITYNFFRIWSLCLLTDSKLKRLAFKAASTVKTSNVTDNLRRTACFVLQKVFIWAKGYPGILHGHIWTHKLIQPIMVLEMWYLASWTPNKFIWWRYPKYLWWRVFFFDGTAFNRIYNYTKLQCHVRGYEMAFAKWLIKQVIF